MSAIPQIEDGYTRIANEILVHIARASLNGTQFRIVLVVWRFTYGFQRKGHELSLNFLSKAIGASRSQIDRELTALIERKILIVVGVGGRGSRQISFNKNYTEWIDRPLNSGQSSNQSTVLSSNLGTEVSANPRTKKENIKEKKKDMSVYETIISYLNEKAGKRFSYKSEANKKLINGRMAEGRTVEDFKYVIDVKCDHWVDDPKMNEYLRPSTLFAQRNFENYLNQKPKQETKRKSDQRDKEIAFQRWVQEGNDPNEFDWGN